MRRNGIYICKQQKLDDVVPIIIMIRRFLMCKNILVLIFTFYGSPYYYERCNRKFYSFSFCEAKYKILIEIKMNIITIVCIIIYSSCSNIHFVLLWKLYFFINQISSYTQQTILLIEKYKMRRMSQRIHWNSIMFNEGKNKKSCYCITISSV